MLPQNAKWFLITVNFLSYTTFCVVGFTTGLGRLILEYSLRTMMTFVLTVFTVFQKLLCTLYRKVSSYLLELLRVTEHVIQLYVVIEQTILCQL